MLWKCLIFITSPCLTCSFFEMFTFPFSICCRSCTHIYQQFDANPQIQNHLPSKLTLKFIVLNKAFCNYGGTDECTQLEFLSFQIAWLTSLPVIIARGEGRRFWLTGISHNKSCSSQPTVGGRVKGSLCVGHVSHTHRHGEDLQWAKKK